MSCCILFPTLDSCQPMPYIKIKYWQPASAFEHLSECKIINSHCSFFNTYNSFSFIYKFHIVFVVLPLPLHIVYKQIKPISVSLRHPTPWQELQSTLRFVLHLDLSPFLWVAAHSTSIFWWLIALLRYLSGVSLPFVRLFSPCCLRILWFYDFYPFVCIIRAIYFNFWGFYFIFIFISYASLNSSMNFLRRSTKWRRCRWWRLIKF